MKSGNFQNYAHWFPETEDLETVDDAFENHFFELKNVLCNSLPVQQLFSAKLIQFSKIVAAYEEIMGKEPNDIEFNSMPTLVENTTFSDVIIHAFDAYHVQRNELLLKIRSLQSFENLSQLAFELCALEQSFSKLWKAQLEEEMTVVMSKLPDDVALRSAILAFTLTGSGTFSELIVNLSDAHVVLKNELYRRNLIFSYGK